MQTRVEDKQIKVSKLVFELGYLFSYYPLEDESFVAFRIEIANPLKFIKESVSKDSGRKRSTLKFQGIARAELLQAFLEGRSEVLQVMDNAILVEEDCLQRIKERGYDFAFKARAHNGQVINSLDDERYQRDCFDKKVVQGVVLHHNGRVVQNLCYVGRVLRGRSVDEFKDELFYSGFSGLTSEFFDLDKLLSILKKSERVRPYSATEQGLGIMRLGRNVARNASLPEMQVVKSYRALKPFKIEVGASVVAKALETYQNMDASCRSLTSPTQMILFARDGQDFGLGFGIEKALRAEFKFQDGRIVRK